MSSVTNASITVSRRELIKVTAASLIGTTLEFYDFLLFGFVAPVFAMLFFPSSSMVASLLAVFAAFAVGFIGRPIGAILFGHVGDRIGRKYTLIITLTCMGAASLATAFLPTYKQVGLLAPTLLVALRLFAGLSLGGELGAGTTLTGEFAFKETRGFWVGITQMAQGGGPLIASFSVGILSAMLGAGGFAATGWRILFGLGVLIAIVGVAMRIGISESPLFKKKEKSSVAEKVPVMELLSKHRKMFLLGWGVNLQGTVMVYLTGVFAVSYMILVAKVSLATAALISSCGYVVLTVGPPFAGYLMDKFGRRPVIVGGTICAMVFVYPYYLMLSSGVLALMILAQVVIDIFISIFTGTIVLLTEIFPTKVRVTGLSLVYQLNSAVFGGTTALIATYLIFVMHFSLAPMYYGFIVMAISLISILLLRETRKVDLAVVQ